MKREFVDATGLFAYGSESLLILLLVAGFLLFQLLKLLKKGEKRRRSSFHNRQSWKSRVSEQWQPTLVSPSKPSMADPQAQMQAISKVNFEKKRLLNKTEYKVLCILERIVTESGSGHRIMAQTSLGELIQPRTNSGTEAHRRDAYASVNSKRLDFAIVDRYGLLALAIEVQGSGHYQDNAFMRDAVKREALRRAGVELIEIQESWTPEDIAHRVKGQLLPASRQSFKDTGVRANV